MKASTHNQVITLNMKGRTTLVPNEYSQKFIDYAAQCETPVLDIGAAFGVATLPALEAGATVVANDIEEKHLEAIYERTPHKRRGHLILKLARFPDQLYFPHESLSAVHASNLLNFLTGEEIEEGVALIFRWLRPQGKVFTNSGTPYAGNIREYIPIYEKRRLKGHKWPGEVDNIQFYSSHPTIQELPTFLHLLDDEILVKVFTDAGFRIDIVEMYHRANLPDYLYYDGRENVGLIATKP
jgi:hypothetical protein